MCDIYYHVIPPKIYEQMLVGMFKIAKNADPEMYSNFFKREKEKRSANKKKTK
jgi:hypothetical protein